MPEGFTGVSAASPATDGEENCPLELQTPPAPFGNETLRLPVASGVGVGPTVTPRFEKRERGRPSKAGPLRLPIMGLNELHLEVCV